MLDVKNTLRQSLVLLVLSGFAASAALSISQSEVGAASHSSLSSRDLRSGFGRPETITGTISGVDPRGLLILKREGPSEPATTQLTVTETRDPNTAAPSKSEVLTSPGPGQTDYTFRLTSSTQIRVDGQTRSLGDLAGLENRRATVHFIPRRSGNFASIIEIGQ